MPRIFLTHAPDMLANFYGERALTELRALGEVKLNPHGRVMTEAEVIAAAQGATIIISDRATTGGGAIFAALPELVAFGRNAVDIRNIDVAAASAAGVLVTQASPGFMAAVAEWILGAMVAAGRHSFTHVADYRAGRQPGFVMGAQLSGATLGIIGHGAIGRHLSPLALGLGMQVLVHDPYQTVAPPLVQTDLKTLLAQSDYVVPLAVATTETENLMGAAEFAQMKPTAWLINASRGNLIDEAALEAALDARRIAGAALDVGRAPDQMPSPHLARRPDVIATPHVAGLTPQSIEHQALETARQAAAILRGEIPKGAVNADQATRMARLRR